MKKLLIALLFAAHLAAQVTTPISNFRASGTNQFLSGSTTSFLPGSELILSHGSTPVSPVNGQMWTTTSGLYVYINGSTVGPLGTGGGGGGSYTFTAADFNESGSTVSLDYTNAQAASGSNKGFLTSADWTTFNAKLGTAAIGSTVQAYDADLTTWAGVTPGTGVATALGIAVGSSGALVTNGGALGTPSSGTVTNLTGTASININGTVGATTPATGAFTTITAASSSVTAYPAGNTGAALQFNLANGELQTATLTAATPALTFTGWAASGKLSVLRLWIYQDGTGGRAPTWPGAVQNTPTIDATAGSMSMVTLLTIDGATTIYSISGAATEVAQTITNGVTTTAPSQDAVFDALAAYASDTVTLTNKTIDAAGTGNVLKQKQYIYLVHPHRAEGTNATIGTTATSITYGHAAFAGSDSIDQADNWVEYYIQVPEDIDTTVALRARIKVLLGNTDTATHRYVLSSVSVADSAVPTASTLANAINIDFAGDGSGASGDVETSAWTTLTSWAGALTAGQTWRIRFARDGNATEDASTVNSTELGLVIEYGSTQ